MPKITRHINMPKIFSAGKKTPFLWKVVWNYFQFENVNVMRKKNDTFNITIHYLYVWYENKVIAKISQQDELTKFSFSQLLD